MALQADEQVKQLGDVVSIVTVVGTLAELLPAMAAILTIIWTAIRIWETDTVQTIIHRKDIQKDKEE
jgi:hypothetical protein|tara:strand:+ start:1090 stop:1290 length:201 start_codon:yes stop_codon:yes gene_type:complete